MTAPAPLPDQVLVDIADYVCRPNISDEPALSAAHLCLTDTLAGALDALDFPECVNLLGPVIRGTLVPNGARVPGTHHELDPEAATFSLGCMIRWLDFNDAFNAAQGIHPSDSLAGILSLADHLSRQSVSLGRQPLVMRDVLESLINAYEIQGCIALENNFGEALNIDHTLLERIACSAVLTRMLGGSREQVIAAISNAFIDVSLVIYRRQNPGLRKNWQCAEAMSQAMRIARLALKGEPGYPQVLTAPREGFYDARCNGRAFKFQRPYGEYIIQHSNFKVLPAGMHSQTAAECAFKLYPLVYDRIADIERIEVRCCKALIAAGIDQNGPLRTAADRDHCAAYNVAICLLNGRLTARDYEDAVAADPRIDLLRAKIVVKEDPTYTEAFHDPARRANASSIRIWFTDGSSTAKVEIEYPAGHWKRRAEGAALLRAKLEASLARRFTSGQQEKILRVCDDPLELERTPVNAFVDLWVHDLASGNAK